MEAWSAKKGCVALFDAGLRMGEMQRQAATDQTRHEQNFAVMLEGNFPDFLIDSLPCTFFVVNKEGRLVRWNRNFQILSEYSDQEIVAMSVLDIVTEERRAAVADALRQAFEESMFEIEVECRTKSGRVVPLLVTARRAAIGEMVCLIGTGRQVIERRPADERILSSAPVDKTTGRPTGDRTTEVPRRNAADEIVGLAGVGPDVADCKRLEEAYHAIVDHSLQGLTVIQNMRIVFANEAMQKISGYSRKEILTSAPELLRDFVHPLDRDLVWGYHEARLNGASVPDRYEFRIIRKDGSTRWIQIHTSRVEYQGQPAIQAACIDTTERRRAEEALRRSEARNEAFLNANPDLMFRLSRGGVFLDCKPPKEDILSASAAQFIGKHLEEVFPAALTRTLMRQVQAALETGQVQTLEYSLPRANGADSDFECRLVACAEQEVVAIVRNISDRRRAERLARLQRDVAIRLSSQSDLQEALQYCLEAAVKAAQMDCGGIYTLDEQTGCLRLDVHLGLTEAFVDSTSTYPLHSRSTRAVLKGEPIYARHDKLGVPLGPAQQIEKLRGIGIIPIQHDGRVVACLNVASHTIDEVPQWSRVVLETIAAQIGSAVSRLKIQAALLRAEQEKAIILDTMPQIVTYHDTSHRILWANRTAVAALNRTVDEIVGHRCHELWEGKATPCAGCPVDLALRTGCSQQAEILGYNGGTWLVRGEPVRDGDGRLLGVVEMTLEISELKRAEERLRERLQFEELVAGVSADFASLREEEIDAGIDRALARLGRFAGVDRSFIYMLHDAGAKISRMYEWCAAGVESHRDRVSNVDVGALSWAIDQAVHAGILNVPRLCELPEPAESTRLLLGSIGVKSFLCIPIRMGGHLFGFLGLSCVRAERSWSEDAVSLLKIIAELMANALTRKRATDQLNDRLAFETLLSGLSATFINLPAPEIDGAIERWLARIGQFLGIDRGTVIQFLAHRAAITHAWAAPGLQRASSDLSEKDFEWSLTQMCKGGTFVCSRLEDIPAEARHEREYCEREGLRSIVAIPLEVAGSMLGVVSFASVRTQRNWSEELVQRLCLVGQVFANALLRRRAEEALRASETRLRSIVRAAPTGIGLVSGRMLLEVNDRIGEMLGYRREELVNQDARILYPTEEEYERVGREKYRQIEERGTGTVETRWRRKDGGIINVLLSSTPLDPADRSKGTTFAALDITERKRAEEALRESEFRFRHLAELLPQTIFETDARGFFTFVNRAALEQFGYEDQEVSAVHVLQTVVPDDRERAARNIEKKLAGVPIPTNEYTALRKDGTTFPVLLYSSPILCDGRPAGIRGILVDITEREQAEAALRESEQNYREIFNAANDAVLIHDPETGAILDVNRTVLETYGYSYEEALQLKVGEGGPSGSPYTREEALARIRRAAEEGPQLFEWLSRKKNGAPIWEEVNLRTATIGGKRRVLAVVRDITDRKKTDAQVQQHLAELTRAWHANTLGEMASGLAHELNQPLCAVINYSNACLRLLRKDGYSIETVRDSVERIAVQAQRAADIIKRIRGLVAKREPQRTELGLSSILAATVQMLREEAVRHRVEIVSRLQDDLPVIKGDAVEIEQVVLNLLRNAIEAMSDARVSRRNLTLSNCLRDRRMIEVAVTDTGRGIPPELSEKIFESFFTTKPQGLGIGLSLSRRIIEAHGGRLWVESDGRSGATFRFTLPVEGADYG